MTVFVGCPECCRYHTASAVYDLVFNTDEAQNEIKNQASMLSIILKAKFGLRDLSGCSQERAC